MARFKKGESGNLEGRPKLLITREIAPSSQDTKKRRAVFREKTGFNFITTYYTTSAIARVV